MSLYINKPVEDPNNAKVVGIRNRKDTKEDLEDFPPIPSTMVLPNGTQFPIFVRYIKTTKLKKSKKKENKKNRDRRDRKNRTPEEVVQDIADEIDEICVIYNIFIEEQEFPTKINRIVKWLNLKLVGANVEAMEHEAVWKKEDLQKDAKAYCKDHIQKSIKNIQEQHSHDKFNLHLEELSSNILEDLELFYQTVKWSNIVSAYCEDPFSTAWFSDKSSYLIDSFKTFILQKYKTNVLMRYKTFFSYKQNIVHEQSNSSAMQYFHDEVEYTLKFYLNELLKIEDEYAKDIKTISQNIGDNKKSTGWIYSARKALHQFLN